MRSIPVLAVIASVGSILAPALVHASAAEQWVVVHDEAGMQVWRRDDQDVLTTTTLRSHDVVPVPIAQVMALLWDSDSRCEWVQGCRESRILARPGKLTTLQYTRSDSGAMMPDRDVVLENRLVLHPGDGSARLTFHAVDDAHTPPQRFVVRMPTMDGFFLLKRLDSQHTEVTYQATVDPGGGMPSFMVRAPMVTKVVEMLQGLRARLLRGVANTQVLRDIDLTGFNAPPN